MADVMDKGRIKCIENLGIVPFVATPLKGRFVVFSIWLLIGYVIAPQG